MEGSRRHGGSDCFCCGRSWRRHFCYASSMLFWLMLLRVCWLAVGVIIKKVGQVTVQSMCSQFVYRKRPLSVRVMNVNHPAFLVTAGNRGLRNRNLTVLRLPRAKVTEPSMDARAEPNIIPSAQLLLCIEHSMHSNVYHSIDPATKKSLVTSMTKPRSSVDRNSYRTCSNLGAE